MIPGDLLSAFPHRQFHTLPGLLDSWGAVPNAYPNALRAMQGGSLYHFHDGLWYDPAELSTGQFQNQLGFVSLYHQVYSSYKIMNLHVTLVEVGLSTLVIYDGDPNFKVCDCHIISEPPSFVSSQYLFAT